MNSNELRIGNYFKDRGGKILRLDFWDLGMKPAQRNFVEGLEVHAFTEDLQYCQPIPLTEEILLKCGFENDPHDKAIFLKTYRKQHVIAIGRDGSVGLCNSLREYKIGTTFLAVQIIEYLHQLQNLYFALTGEELNVRL